jgi:hypothetical protein
MTPATFTIDKDVPRPRPYTPGGGYPFAQMKVGDSFRVGKDWRARVANAAVHFVRRHQPTWKFSVRLFEGGCRCWRIQ